MYRTSESSFSNSMLVEHIKVRKFRRPKKGFRRCLDCASSYSPELIPYDSVVADHVVRSSSSIIILEQQDFICSKSCSVQQTVLLKQRVFTTESALKNILVSNDSNCSYETDVIVHDDIMSHRCFGVEYRKPWWWRSMKSWQATFNHYHPWNELNHLSARLV